MNRSLNVVLVQICSTRGDSLFHSCNDGDIARKMLPTQSIFHWMDGNQKAPNLDYVVGVVDSPSRIDSVFHLLPTDIGPGVTVLQENISSLVYLWKFEPSAQSASWWSSQSWCFAQVPGNLEGSSFSYHKRQCTSFYPPRAVSWTFLSWGTHMLSLHGLCGGIMSHLQ